MNFAAIFGGSLWSGYALPACHPRKWPPTATGRDSTIQSGNLSRRSRPPLLEEGFFPFVFQHLHAFAADTFQIFNQDINMARKLLRTHSASEKGATAA